MQRLLQHIRHDYQVTLDDQINAVNTKIASKVNEHQNSVKNIADDQLTPACEKDAGGQTAGSLYDALTAEAKTALSNVASFDDLTEEQKAAFTTIDTSNFAALKDVNTHTKALDSATTKLNNAKAAQASLTANETNYTNAQKVLADLQSATPTTTVSTGAVTMTSSTNVDEIISKVKEFVATYNGFIKDLTDQTKQPKYRDFKPLTAASKKGNGRKEIKLWEEKARVVY